METLPVAPPLTPMLGRRVDELPTGDVIYEPKWDGFRCLAFRAGDQVELRSRHDRPLGRYFPELVERRGLTLGLADGFKPFESSALWKSSTCRPRPDPGRPG